MVSSNPTVGTKFEDREILMNNSDGGKGDSPRPLSVPFDDYSKRWDDIFKKPLPEREDKVTRYNEETQEVLNREN